MHTVRRFAVSDHEFTVCYEDRKILGFDTFDEAAAFASYLNGGAKPVKTVSLDPFDGVSTSEMEKELRKRGEIWVSSKAFEDAKTSFHVWRDYKSNMENSETSEEEDYSFMDSLQKFFKD